MSSTSPISDQDRGQGATGDATGDSARGLGFYIPRSVFPATREQLICEARRAQAPESAVQALRRLAPSPVTFPDLQSVDRELASNATG